MVTGWLHHTEGPLCNKFLEERKEFCLASFSGPICVTAGVVFRIFVNKMYMYSISAVMCEDTILLRPAKYFSQVTKLLSMKNQHCKIVTLPKTIKLIWNLIHSCH